VSAVESSLILSEAALAMTERPSRDGASDAPKRPREGSQGHC
jgi:hypothetical protein